MHLMAAKQYPELKIILTHCGDGGIFFCEAIVAVTRS